MSYVVKRGRFYLSILADLIPKVCFDPDQIGAVRFKTRRHALLVASYFPGPPFSQVVRLVPKRTSARATSGG